MSVDELINLGSDKVRGSSDLMAIYVDLFTKTFGKSPNCASCSFSSDWNKLSNRLKIDKTNIIMNQNKYRLKRIENRILTYKLKGIPYRIYDYLLTDQFAKEFITHGTAEELKERKLLFESFPEVSKIENDEKEQVVSENVKSVGDEVSQPDIVPKSKTYPSSKKRKRK